MPNLTTLKAVCAKATPGEWRLWNGYGPDGAGHMRCAYIGPPDTNETVGRAAIFAGSAPGDCDVAGKRENLEFIATFSPTLIARLLAVVEAARESQKHWHQPRPIPQDDECMKKCPACKANRNLQDALTALGGQ